MPTPTAGDVAAVANIILQRPFAAHAAHLGILQAMLAAAPEAEQLLTGPLSPAKLQEEGTLQRFSRDFDMGTVRGSTINTVVFRRISESVLQYPGCTAFASREELAPLLNRVLLQRSCLSNRTSTFQQTSLAFNAAAVACMLLLKY